MRRMIHRKSSNPIKAILYIIIGLAMAVYAIPRLPAVSFSIRGAFTVIWLLFTFLFVASNLYYLLGVDKEARQVSDQQPVVDKLRHNRKALMND